MFKNAQKIILPAILAASLAGCGAASGGSSLASSDTATAVVPEATSPAVQGIASISWLAGTWFAQQGDTTSEVYYSAPQAGTMLGLMRMTAGQEVTFYEFEKIAEDNGSIVLFPSPNGTPGVTFKMTTLNGQSAVFENPENDFPRRITLSVVENSLHMKVEGTQGGNPVAQELVMPRK